MISESSKNKEQKSNKPALLGVGNPDLEDKENILSLIDIYESVYPYPHPESIGMSVQLGLAETDRSKQSGDGNIKRTSLPVRFVKVLKKAYPLIMKDKNQFEWFMTEFPVFDLTNAYNDSHDDYKKGKAQ